MMVVRIINLRAIFVYLALMLSFVVSAQTKVPNDGVFIFLHENVAKSTAALGKAIESCEKERVSAKVILLNNDLLKKINALNADVIIALTHMSFSNTFQCERSERVNLAYYLGLLSSIKRQYQSKTKDINEIEDNLVYPSVKQIRLSTKYLQLPTKLRKYMKEAIGSRPFDLIKTLKMNGLLKI